MQPAYNLLFMHTVRCAVLISSVVAMMLLLLLKTKWTVSATVFAVLLWQHNEYAAWCVVGAVFSAFLCKVSKW
jgi:hypothetical protein